MIPHMMLLLMDESEFVALGAPQSPATPFYGYFPPSVSVFKDNRIFATKDNRVDIIKDNRARITVT